MTHHSKKAPPGVETFSELADAMWVVILAMTSVGYGDLVPSTHMGQVFVVAGCFSGIYIIMLIAVNIQRMISQESEEAGAYEYIVEMEEKHEIKRLSAILIQRFVRYQRYIMENQGVKSIEEISLEREHRRD